MPGNPSMHSPEEVFLMRVSACTRKAGVTAAIDPLELMGPAACAISGQRSLNNRLERCLPVEQAQARGGHDIAMCVAGSLGFDLRHTLWICGEKA